MNKKKTEDFTPSFVVKESGEVKSGMTTGELVLSITRNIFIVLLWLNYWFVFILINHVREDAPHMFRAKWLGWVCMIFTMWLYIGFISEKIKYIKKNLK